MGDAKELRGYYSYQRECVYRTKHKGDILYSKDILDIECSSSELLHFLDASERIKDACNSIDIASVLMDCPRPNGKVFMHRHYPINKDDTVGKYCRTVNFGHYNFDITYPTFVLVFKKKMSDTRFTHRFIIECDKEHKIIYPIKEFASSHTVDIAVKIGSDFKIVENNIHNEEEFIEHLKKILINM